MDAKIEAQKKILKVLVFIAAALFIVNGAAKIMQYSIMIDFLSKMNYNKIAAIVIGVIEIGGAIGLMFKSSRFYISIFLILLMVGAIGSTIGAKMEFAKALWPAAVLVLLSAVAYYDNFIAAEEEEEEIEHRNDPHPATN